MDGCKQQSPVNILSSHHPQSSTWSAITTPASLPCDTPLGTNTLTTFSRKCKLLKILLAGHLVVFFYKEGVFCNRKSFKSMMNEGYL